MRTRTVTLVVAVFVAGLGSVSIPGSRALPRAELPPSVDHELPPSRPAGLAAPGPPCWLPPVDAPVSDPFRAPSCPYCAGNRGVDFATGAGATVRAVAAGRVTFAGSVAGTGYVVVRHPDGRRATYGGVTGTPWRAGDHVAAGAFVGRTTHDLHFGVRDTDGEYEDPTPYLGRVVHRRRLLPLDGGGPRPAPPPQPRCSAPRSG